MAKIDDKEQKERSAALMSSIWRETEEGLDQMYGEDTSARREEKVARLAQATALDLRLAKIESVLQEISGKLDH